jgi:hypothetical protein
VDVTSGSSVEEQVEHLSAEVLDHGTSGGTGTSGTSNKWYKRRGQVVNWKVQDHQDNLDRMQDQVDHPVENKRNV